MKNGKNEFHAMLTRLVSMKCDTHVKYLPFYLFQSKKKLISKGRKTQLLAFANQNTWKLGIKKVKVGKESYSAQQEVQLVSDSCVIISIKNPGLVGQKIE